MLLAGRCRSVHGQTEGHSAGDREAAGRAAQQVPLHGEPSGGAAEEVSVVCVLIEIFSVHVLKNLEKD